jgi:hypothetical protein
MASACPSSSRISRALIVVVPVGIVKGARRVLGARPLLLAPTGLPLDDPRGIRHNVVLADPEATAATSSNPDSHYPVIMPVTSSWR